jgi:LysM repeat protein
MCGAELTHKRLESDQAERPVPESPDIKHERASEVSIPQPASATLRPEESTTVTPNAIESVMVERQSTVTIWLTIGFIILVIILGALVFQFRPATSLAFLPTLTPIPPTITHTPTWTPLPSETPAPTETPTITPPPLPTGTPRPPRTHTIASGDTLFGLSFLYGIGAESIAEENPQIAEFGLQVSQELLIPWPTATPPLEPISVEIGGETVIADPTNCEVYKILGGDTFSGIASRHRVDLGALIAVNRLTDQSVLQPGDTICIPRIIRGGVLPPTPGPSPTPTVTKPPAGPYLLYPPSEVTIDPPGGPVVLQWAAVKDLADVEWYMVEVTDLTAVDSHPMRGFTRQTSFRVPGTWRPILPEFHVFRWRVSIVSVTGERADGSFIYTFGGNRSQDALFNWLGASPTPTPTPTPTSTPEPET